MSKLTLSVDQKVITRARRYAAQRGVSISSMVEAYLSQVATEKSPLREQSEPPVLRSLRGALTRGDAKAYRRHLIDKYR